MAFNGKSVQHVPGSPSMLIVEQHSNQPIRFAEQVYSLSGLGLQPGLAASTSVIFTYHFPLILCIT